MRVVCVNDYGENYGIPSPVRGSTYTIASVHSASMASGATGYFLRLKEGPDPYSWLRGWWYLCFKPLVTRSIEHDLAIFRPILDQVREDA